MRKMQNSRRPLLALTYRIRGLVIALAMAGTAISWNAMADDGSGGNEGFLENWTFNGYLKNETAYRYREPRSITKIRNILSLGGQYTASSSISATF